MLLVGCWYAESDSYCVFTLQRVEKERDNLTETNARLLRQSAEKDDMNAKSLSTILHLKNLTEQLQQQKISLELQLKSAGQLSLAARLATNAKDRVAEEVVKEKEVSVLGSLDLLCGGPIVLTMNPRFTGN